MAGSPPSARPDLASADLRALLDAADVAVVGRTMPGDVITCWNAGAEALYGWPRAEALGRAAGDLLRTAYPRPLAAIAASLAREGRWAGELRQTTRAGRRLVVESRWTPRRDGDGAPLVALAIERDVTAERRTEARLRGLLEAAPDAMIVADERGRIALANGQVERLFGYASDDLLRRPVEDLLPEAVRARHARQREGYGAAPHARPMGIGLELAGCRRDGATFPVEVSLSPLHTDEGLLVIASIRDVTERHQREARQRFLAGAGEILAAALDYEQTLAPVARLAVPVLADYTAVDLVDDRGRLRRIGMAHRAGRGRRAASAGE